MALRFSVFPAPQAEPYPALAARTKRLEAMGFDVAYLADETPMAFPGVITFEAWSTLSALARDTTRIRLGTMVTPPVLRHPLVTAMAVSTLDHVSDGRAVLAMGVGGVAEDSEGVGQGGLSNRDLLARLDEQLETIDRLLRGETVTREAGFYPTRNAVVGRPLQVPRPPIIVAAQGPESLKVVARRADAWNSLGGQPLHGDRLSSAEAAEIVRGHIERLEAACADVGRDPATVGRTIFAWRTGIYAGLDGIDDWVGRYLELGFEEFILLWPGDDEPASIEILERFAADSMPRLRARAA